MTWRRVGRMIVSRVSMKIVTMNTTKQLLYKDCDDKYETAMLYECWEDKFRYPNGD